LASDKKANRGGSLEDIEAGHLILAFVALTMLPTIVMFLFAQKHVVAGLTAEAVKG
jgi:ABC-type glycerol-3-phosphate transport system permease component